MVKFIILREGMSAVYFYYGGMLLINAALPKQRILEIIEEHLDLE